MRINIRGRRTTGAPTTGNGSRAIAPAIAPLLVAASEGSDLLEAANRLAATYGLQGEPLDRFVGDLEACLAAAGLRRADSAMLRSTSIAWADAYAGHFEQMTCCHAATGLSSVHHLQAHVQRLSRVWLRASTSVPRQDSWHVLIVVDVPRERATRATMSIVNERLQAHVPTAEVVAALSSNRSAALVLAPVDPVALAEEIRADLQHRLSPFGPSPRIWVETLPDDHKRATNLVQELTR